MTQYIMHSQYRSHFGMDVHARTVTISGIDLKTGETVKKRFSNCPDPSEIAGWMQTVFPGPHYAAYESGCTGFYLCRKLRTLGVDCDVIAVSSIARSTDDKRKKSDDKDARRLLQEMITPGSELSRVWLPDEELEGMRDLARAHRDSVIALKRLKQQLSALLLRNGYVWNERTARGNLKTTWTEEYKRWLNKVVLPSNGAAEALKHYRASIHEVKDRVGYMEAEIRTAAKLPHFRPYVDALCCLKGIDVCSAFLYTVEIGRFSRFGSPRSLSSYFGLTPSSSASGDELEANGRITKTGNSHARITLVEGLANMTRTNDLPKKLQKDQVVSESVRSHCNCANRRIKKRYEHLVSEKKLANKIKVALANELARWIWSVGLMVEKEQAA